MGTSRSSFAEQGAASGLIKYDFRCCWRPTLLHWTPPDHSVCPETQNLTLNYKASGVRIALENPHLAEDGIDRAHGQVEVAMVQRQFDEEILDALQVFHCLAGQAN